jgi:hypothetical protein
MLTGLNRLLQILSGRPMNQKHARSAASFSLPDQASIEAYMIRRANANAENRRLAINGDSSSANPLFDFTTRAHTSARKDLLKPFSNFATLSASTASVSTVPLLRNSRLTG